MDWFQVRDIYNQAKIQAAAITVVDWFQVRDIYNKTVELLGIK